MQLHLWTWRRWVDVVLEHLPNHFKPGLGQLVNEGFEVVAGGHDANRIANAGGCTEGATSQAPGG